MLLNSITFKNMIQYVSFSFDLLIWSDLRISSGVLLQLARWLKRTQTLEYAPLCDPVKLN